MASFTGVGDNVEQAMIDKGENVDIAISGTYNMTILFQREVGSPGSGAWETITTYTTANATVADVYVTRGYNETVRLVVTVDTSGTATATLADGSILEHGYRTIRDRVGNVLASFSQGGATLPGSFRGGAPIAGATMTVDPATHANRVIVFPAAGGTVTLPAALGTGYRYRFFVEILLTTNLVINAVSGDVFAGGLMVATDVGGISMIAVPGDDIITLNQTTSGGLAGSFVELEDAAAGFWICTGWIVSSGAESTPFSQV